MDVQADSFFSKNKKGVSVFSISKGYVIPVLKVDREVELRKEEVVNVSTNRNFRKDLFDGCYQDHVNLSVVFSSGSWYIINNTLNDMKYVPFPKLEHLSFECSAMGMVTK